MSNFLHLLDVVPELPPVDSRRLGEQNYEYYMNPALSTLTLENPPVNKDKERKNKDKKRIKKLEAKIDKLMKEKKKAKKKAGKKKKSNKQKSKKSKQKYNIEDVVYGYIGKKVTEKMASEMSKQAMNKLFNNSNSLPSPKKFPEKYIPTKFADREDD